jgi:hypothetical protein
MSRLWWRRILAIAAGVIVFGGSYLFFGLFAWTAMHQEWPQWFFVASAIAPPALGVLTAWWLYPHARQPPRQ